MNLEVSVVICCYNSADRLPETLRHLAIQDAESIGWEVVVVNNKSTDDTGKVAYEEWEKLGEPAPLLVVDESRPGLSFARKKGINVSKGEVIIFCDDDNWLAQDYISRVSDLFKSTSYQMVGGWGIPVADTNFPPWFNQLEGYGYAVGKQGRSTGAGYAVHGAGMAIRKSIALFLLDTRYRPFLSDRKGKSLSTGGDAEISVLIGGKNAYFDESLIYHHYLPTSRLKWSYLDKMIYYTGIADSYLYFYKLVHNHWYLALKRYIYKTYSSTVSLIKLGVRSFFSKATLEEKLELTHLKGFTLFMFLHLIDFRKNHLQAKSNALLFNDDQRK